MKRLLIPLVLLLVGVGGGVGAGLVLAPSGEAATEPATEATPEGEALPNPCGPPPEGDHHATSEDEAEPTDDKADEVHDYIKLNNQFVVPLLTDGRVASLVMLSLSVETPAGREEQVLAIEPKLRDIFLQVLFDHANTGGFDGLFTATSAMRTLRGALLEAVQAEVGPIVTDVLITDLVRQEQ